MQLDGSGNRRDKNARGGLEKQRRQNAAGAGGEHSEKHSARPEHRRHGQPKQNDGGEAEVPEIVCQAAPNHLHHIGRTGDVNSKILLIELMHDSLEMPDRLLGVFAFHENDDIAGPTVLDDEQPAPKRTSQRVLKTLRPLGQTLDRAHRIDRLDLLLEFLDSTEILRRSNIP